MPWTLRWVSETLYSEGCLVGSSITRTLTWYIRTSCTGSQVTLTALQPVCATLMFTGGTITADRDKAQPDASGTQSEQKNPVPNFFKGKTSLTGGDGLHFALAPHTATVCCIDVAVVVGGGLQVFHHCAGVGEGHIEGLSSGLRFHQQVVKFCWGDSTPLDHDGCAGNCPSVCYLGRVRNWVMREEKSFKAFKVIVSLYWCMQSHIINDI